MIDIEDLEDAIVERLNVAITDGVLASVLLIGDDADSNSAAKLPGATVLFRRAALQRDQAIDITRQTGILEWSVFAGGVNMRTQGLRAGRRGASGAYHAAMMVIKYLVGFEPISGFPIWLNSIDLSSFDPRAGRALYELSFQHEFVLVQDGYD